MAPGASGGALGAPACGFRGSVAETARGGSELRGPGRAVRGEGHGQRGKGLEVARGWARAPGASTGQEGDRRGTGGGQGGRARPAGRRGLQGAGRSLVISVERRPLRGAHPPACHSRASSRRGT